MDSILTGNFVEDALMARWEYLADNNVFDASHSDDTVMQELIKNITDNGVPANSTASEIIDDIVINYVILDLTDVDEVKQYEDPIDNAVFVTADSKYAIIK